MSAYISGKASGGDSINFINGNFIHQFTTVGSQTFTVPQPITAQVLIVGGGGGGGGTFSYGRSAGGGGAGGLVYYASVLIDPGTYTVTVGGGGAGNTAAGTGGNGGNSSVSGLGLTTAIGGGGGGGNNTNGANGGSGGGKWHGTTTTAGTGTAGQGNNGSGGYDGGAPGPWTAGGGGGAGAVGGTGTVTVAGSGGVGLQYSISGTATFYAGGGGGGAQFASGGTQSSGGNGGGGKGGLWVGTSGGTGTAATPGTNGTGGGGGGGANDGSANASYYVPGRDGGSGIVIISYSWNIFNVFKGLSVNTINLSGKSLFSQLSSTAASSAVGAFSLRAVNGISAKAVNIRRSSDNATQDFYADRLGNLLTAPVSGQSLASWLGTATGYVATWYDQSGKGNHASQATSANQPKIDFVNKQIDFKPSAYFNLPNGTVPYGNSNYTMVVRHNTINSNPADIVHSGTQGTTDAVNALEWNGTAYYNYWWGDDNIGGSLATGNIVTAKYDNTVGRTLYINGTSVATNASKVRNSTQLNNLIATDTRNRYLNGELYYVFLFNTALSDADRQLVEALPIS